jgi:uncharacterized radical SAM protein YgiQ
MIKGFLPSTKKETEDLGWKRPDIIIVTGDAYIDHPYFQAASAGRFLNANSFRTAILDMPDISKVEDWKKLGKPSLFFLVITGKEDSMAMNYTAYKKFRSTDPYVPGGKRTHRPDRAVIKYCNVLKSVYKDVPIILAGPEAAGRLSTHYDYWTDKLRKPILFDSKADMVLFGTIEHNLVKIAELIKSGQRISDIKKLNGTAYISKDVTDMRNYKRLPSHEKIEKDISMLSEHHLMIHLNMNPYRSEILVQKVMDRFLVIHKSQQPIDEEMTDEIFSTGFKRKAHPKYKEEIPILRFINDLIITHRGCLNDRPDSQDILTEGRFICSRSNEKIRREIISFIKSKEYNKTIKIFGLPFFNHYAIKTGNQKQCGECERLSCTLPGVCPNIKPQSVEIIRIIEGFDKFPNVRNNFYGGEPDMKLLLSEKEIYKDYLTRRNDGNIQIRAESFSDDVRSLLGLDDRASIVKDIKFLIKRSGEYGKKINFSINVLTGFPLQDDEEVNENIKMIKELGTVPGDINSYIPMPMTLAGAIYYTGINPVNGKQITAEKKLSVMKKHNEWYKKAKKQNNEKRA